MVFSFKLCADTLYKTVTVQLTLENPDTGCLPSTHTRHARDIMSNSTWLSYLARILLDHMPDRTAGAGGWAETNSNCEADMQSVED